MKCPRCGHEAGGAFCPNCGFHLATASPEGRPPFRQFENPSGQQAPEQKIIPIICIIGAVIFALGFLAYFAFVLLANLLPLLGMIQQIPTTPGYF